MYCKNCGAQLKDGARFCPKCGTPVLQTENKKNTVSIWKIAIPVAIAAVAVIGICYAAFFHGDKNSLEEETTPTDIQTEDVQSMQEDSMEEDEYLTDEDLDENVYEVTEEGIHRYIYMIDDCTWSEAFEAAQEAGGYLAHINSEEELEYIINEITIKGYNNKQFRIGGRRNAENYDYYWVDEYNTTYGDILNSSDFWGESVWLENEPSFRGDGFDETCMDMYYNKSEGRWVWNDVPDDIVAAVPAYSGKVGYIIEFEE